MDIPVLTQEAPGDFLTAALWNGAVVGGIGALQSPVIFKGYATTAQTIASGTTSIPILLDTEEIDTDGGHSVTTNTSRYTCQTAGVFLVFGSVTWAQNTTGSRAAEILKSGASLPGGVSQTSPSAGNGVTSTGLVLVRLAVGDYIELAAWQNSGGSLATSSSSVHLYSTLNIVRISN